MSQANVGTSSFDPTTALSNRMAKRRSGMGITGALLQHGLQKDLLTHTYQHESALSAQEHGQKSSLSSQEHGQNMEELAKKNRHEVRVKTLEHRQGLEKSAHDMHLHTALVGTVLRGAQHGTDVSVKTGAGEVSFTKAQAKAKKAAPGTPAAPTASTEKPKKYAHRDPVTKRITGYHDTPQA